MTTEAVRLVMDRLRHDAEFAEQARVAPITTLAAYDLEPDEHRRIRRVLTGTLTLGEFFE